jgi:uracil-DNA glycosylase
MKTKKYWTDQLGESWTEVLKPLLKSDYIEELTNRLNIDYALNDMYPINQNDIFKAFKLCDFDKLKVVIIGTEPGVYTGVGSLAFSDVSSIYTNPSATKIRECVSDYNKDLGLNFDTTFEEWANQGILMLNRSLTSKKDGSKSYRDDWKKFFGSVLYVIEKYKPGTIFLLWGKEANKYAELLSTNHHVFTWEHPMVANKAFRQWQCPNFKQVDKLLESLYGKERILSW